jgi:tryptophan-rich sensory protein
MMGVAAWLVWRRPPSPPRRTALTLFAVQLVLNALWTPIFFGLEQLGLALVEIVLLEVAVIATIVAFFRLSRPAGALLLPYAAWVAFATYLNYTLWALNR